MQPPTITQPSATMPQGAIAVSGLSLRHNFAWTLAGNLVYAGCQWGMLVVLAKLGSPAMVGQFALGLAVTAPIILFANLSLRPVQATDAKQEYLFGHYLGLRIITTTAAVLVIAGISLMAGYRRETALIILAVGLAKGFESLSDVFYGLLQQHERMDRIAISKMIKGPLSLMALGGAVYLTKGVFWGAAALAVAWALILLGYDMRSGALILRNSSVTHEGGRFATLRPNWPLGKLGRLAWTALPLGFAAMLLSLNGNIPRYFIEHYGGEGSLGIFAALAYLMVANGMLFGALGQSVTPRLAKYYAAGNGAAFRTLLFKLLAIGLALGIAGLLVVWAAGRQILTILYSPEYAAHIGIFILLMVASTISNMISFLNCSITAARYFKVVPPLFALVTITTVLACYLLIPGFGLQGAVLAMIISQVVQAIVSTMIIKYALNKCC